MKTTRIVLAWWVMFAVVCFCSIVSLIAQTNGVPGVPAATAGAFAGSQFWVDLGTPLLTLVLAALVAKFKPQMSAAVLAATVLTLGTISSAIATVVLGSGIQGPGTVAKAAALALGGVVVKVLVDKLGEKPAQ